MKLADAPALGVSSHTPEASCANSRTRALGAVPRLRDCQCLTVPSTHAQNRGVACTVLCDSDSDDKSLRQPVLSPRSRDMSSVCSSTPPKLPQNTYILFTACTHITCVYAHICTEMLE